MTVSALLNQAQSHAAAAWFSDLLSTTQSSVAEAAASRGD